MKIYKIFGLFLSLSLLFVGCEDTNENLVGSRGVGIVPGIVDLNPAIFDSKNLENTYVQFNVELTEGDVAEKAVIVASYNGNNAKVEVLEITSFPANVQLFSSEIANKLGIPIASIQNGDVFTFEMYFTSNGRVTTSSTVLNVDVACAFNPALAVGSYKVVSAAWEVAGDVTFTADENDPYKIYVSGLFAMEGGDANDNVLELNIDPLSYKVDFKKTSLGSTAPWGAYTNYYYSPGSGLYKSCDGAFEMQFAISVDEGAFGTFGFVFTRN